MLDILEDPRRTGVAVVTTSEEMPVTESIELLERLTTETGTYPAAVIANRVLGDVHDATSDVAWCASGRPPTC